jgi:hypothetical protein
MDIRNQSYLLREQKPRVSFGNGWIKNSIIELFKDDIVRYTPLLTTDLKEDAVAKLNKGEIPKLEAIGIHNGTIYRWNRMCYGQNNGVPHMRIENRYIPAGPTVKDEVANALFWIGIMQGMPDRYKNLNESTPFNEVKGNFVNAARTGINTYFNWFGKGISAQRLILEELIPIAYEGLSKSQIDKRDIDKYLAIIEKRAETRHTGAQWLKHSNRILKTKMTKDIANATLTAHLYKNQKSFKNLKNIYSFITKGNTKKYFQRINNRKEILKQRNDLIKKELDLGKTGIMQIVDGWLTNNCLALNDKLSMAHSIESRAPLLDINLMKLAVKSQKNILGYKKEETKYYFNSHLFNYLF